MARYAKVINGVVVETDEQELGFYQAIDGGEHPEWLRVADTPGTTIEISLVPIQTTPAINPATGKPFGSEEPTPAPQPTVVINPFTGEPINEVPAEEPAAPEPVIPVDQVVKRNWADVGYVYDRASGMFRPPRLYASWAYDETAEQWVPPVPSPGDDFVWSEDTQTWVEHPKQIPEPTPEPVVDEQPAYPPLPPDFQM